MHAKRPAAGTSRRAFLFECFAVIKNRDAVEKQDVLRVKRQPTAKTFRLHIADIDQRDLRISLSLKRRKTAGK